MRTTSSLEGMNSDVQRDFPAQTTIFKFTDALKMHESKKSSDLHTLSLEKVSDQQLQRRRKEDRVRDDKIREFTALLKDGQISVLDFLKSMAIKEVLPKDGKNINIQINIFKKYV